MFVQVAPASFTERCVSTMPLKCFVRYVLPNGKKIAGYYDDFTRKLSGLQPMSHLLGDSHLNSINMLLVTYESGGHLTISFFADDFVEVFFAATPLSPGNLFFCLLSSVYFF